MKKKIKLLLMLCGSFVSFNISSCALISASNGNEEINNNEKTQDNLEETDDTNKDSNEDDQKENEESNKDETEEPSKVIPVTGVTLNKNIATLLVGNKLTLSASVLPSNATNKNVIWSSSNEDVASVENGEILGKNAGTARILAKTEDGNYSAYCEVSVTNDVVNVTGISLNYESYVALVGDTFSLTETIEPSNATNQEVVWEENSNGEIISLNNGVVKALKEGEAVVKVTTRDGGYIATCSIKVNPKEEEGTYTPEEDDDIYVINAAGEYTLTRDYKQIYVNAPEAEVVLNLNGFKVENNENSPIYVESVGALDISATKGTTSNIIDSRSIYTEDIEGQGKGAIYVADGDLTLKGKGVLNVKSSYLNGIHAKDDVKIKNLTLNVEAVNHGIRGNDSVTISSGTVDISCGADGLHSENSDISTKGNQRGNITISGGNVTINSWGDAIAASYNAVIEEIDSTIPTVLNLNTNKYSSYNGEIVESSKNTFYLKMNSSTYSNGNYTWAAYINNAWYKATYKGTLTNSTQGGFGGFGGPGGGPGGYSTSYIYEIEKPVGASSFKLYRFTGANVTSFSTTNYNAVSDLKAFNSEYDTVQVSVRSGTISFSNWSNYESNGTSAKGIKAENEIYISGGVNTIKAYDDGIHANNDGTLENGSTPLGNVNISGGETTITSSDDGVHADYILAISGGKINVLSSYEGLEGNLIRVSGGESIVNGQDDGVNAGSGKSTPDITVSGGLIDVTVPTSGDTDGIDSNGTYTQTGGVAIVKGPGSASGSMGGGAFALDTDSTVRISNGTLIVFGGIERTPTYSVTRTLCSSSTVSTGVKTISFSSTSYQTTLKSSSSGCVVYSSLGSATLK